VVVNPVAYGVCDSVAPGVGPSGVDGKLGYIRVSTFSSKTVSAFQDALEDLKAKVGGLLGSWVD
jgi:C-terminal processing protease CtpA/Prc